MPMPGEARPFSILEDYLYVTPCISRSPQVSTDANIDLVSHSSDRLSVREDLFQLHVCGSLQISIRYCSPTSFT